MGDTSLLAPWIWQPFELVGTLLVKSLVEGVEYCQVVGVTCRSGDVVLILGILAIFIVSLTSFFALVHLVQPLLNFVKEESWQS